MLGTCLLDVHGRFVWFCLGFYQVCIRRADTIISLNNNRRNVFELLHFRLCRWQSQAVQASNTDVRFLHGHQTR